MSAEVHDLPRVLREYGQAFRGDWSDIDGRCVRDEMDEIAHWVETAGAYPGDPAARFLLGICPDKRGHWTWHCDEECAAPNGGDR